jgi:hypothetical protein
MMGFRSKFLTKKYAILHLSGARASCSFFFNTILHLSSAHAESDITRRHDLLPRQGLSQSKNKKTGGSAESDIARRHDVPPRQGLSQNAVID